MATPKSRVAKIHAEAMHIPLGTPLLIEPSGMGERFKSMFVGMERKRYVIAKIPNIPGVAEHLFVDKGVTVRYLHEGNVYGFESKVLMVGKAPFKLLFLQYPFVLETLNLRDSHRLDCFLPASVKLGDQWREGMILNISAGGCQLALETKGPHDMSKVDTEGDVLLEFKMFGTEKPIMIGGKPRNVNRNGNRLTMGVQFDGLSEYAEKIISDYLRSVAEYLSE